MAGLWKMVGQAFLTELMNQAAEAMFESMEPEQARVCRLLWRLRAAIARLSCSGRQAEFLVQQLAVFLASDKADLAQGLQVIVQSVALARDVFEGFQEVQELIDEIKTEWDRYNAKNMVKYI